MGTWTPPGQNLISNELEDDSLLHEESSALSEHMEFQVKVLKGCSFDAVGSQYWKTSLVQGSQS